MFTFVELLGRIKRLKSGAGHTDYDNNFSCHGTQFGRI